MEQRMRIEWRIWLYLALIAIAVVAQQDSAEKRRKDSDAGRSLKCPMIVQFPPADIDIPHSEEQLLQATRTNPRDFDAHVYLMCLYSQQHKWHSSLKHALEARRIDPRDVNSHLGAAYCYANLNKLQQSLEVIDAALKRDFIPEDRASLRRVRGDILMEQYRAERHVRLLEQALSNYQLALKEDPKNAQAQVGVARVEIERKRYDLARQRLRNVLSQVKVADDGGRRKKALALFYLGFIEEQQKHIAQALKLYDEAVKTHPPSFVRKK